MRTPSAKEIKVLFTEAKKYAGASAQDTANFSGWEQLSEYDRNQKLSRITRGRLGQLYIARICELNHIPYARDITDPTTTDDFDLIICDKTFDVKVDNGSVPCQVNADVLERKDADYFIFSRDGQKYPSENSRITILGAISYADYKRIAVYTPKGEMIPETTFSNKFHCGTYTLTQEGRWGLIPIDKLLIDLRNNLLVPSISDAVFVYLEWKLTRSLSEFLSKQWPRKKVNGQHKINLG